jgi:hypothetical protein
VRSIRFGVLAIATCGLIGGGAAIQVGIWGGEVGSLAERQEAISNNIIMLRNAGRAMLDMETGQRGYLLTETASPRGAAPVRTPDGGRAGGCPVLTGSRAAGVRPVECP